MGGNEKEVPVDLEWLCFVFIFDHYLMRVGFSSSPLPPAPFGFASLVVTSIIDYLINLMVCTYVG